MRGILEEYRSSTKRAFVRQVEQRCSGNIRLTNSGREILIRVIKYTYVVYGSSIRP